MEVFVEDVLLPHVWGMARGELSKYTRFICQTDVIFYYGRNNIQRDF